MWPSVKQFFNHRFGHLIGYLVLILLFSGEVQNVELNSPNFVQTEEPIPFTRDIVFVGLPGLKYPRLIGCEYTKIADVRVNCTESFSTWVFRLIPATHSGSIRPLIPAETGHPFRLIPATYSG